VARRVSQDPDFKDVECDIRPQTSNCPIRGLSEPQAKRIPAMPEMQDEVQQAQRLSRAQARLLLVEDDEKLACTLARGLEHEGYVVDVSHTGHDAIGRADARDYDAVVLDVLLPGASGHDVCRQIRTRDRWVPVIMLTAIGEVSDRIRGLDAGADDYLVKPFDFGELLARLRALIRRGPSERPRVLEVGALRADPMTRVVTWAGRESELTPREFELLQHLIRRPGQLVSRAQLLDQVWAEDYSGSPNVVDVYVGYLRRKLEHEDGPPLIRTVRGAGFILEPR
jgi:two-component system OmpR family response regulator